ncbi:MAG: TIM barrel protein [Gemmatimonadetes bacterium]|nr:TIM barrel protein [Gemmatimonadota bacterium]MYG84298.1 TIM barrel protein [Gemmatimonadota bacterium]MYJ88877.1 TIM barrel protein [Gemmatimonadota bacterium]
MRLCLDSFVPPLERITKGTASWVRELGFDVIGVDLEPAVPVDANACRAVREILEDEGVSIGQVWSVGTPLVRPDPDESAAHLEVLRERVPLAAALGCRVLLTEAGGMHPANAWYPHPENHGEEALARLVAALKEIAPFAADHGVIIAPEMSLMTILSTVARAEAMVAEVGHPGVGVNFDPANILDPLSLFGSGAFVDDAFDRLGGHIVNVHAKDAAARNVPLIVHLEERPAGQGVLDYERLLRRAASLPEWTCIVVEHLTDYGQVDAVRRFLVETAEKAGVRFE